MTSPTPVPGIDDRERKPKMPVLFIGHGSPMNAIEENPFSRTWENTGRRLPRPEAVLCISAHWLTRGSVRVTAIGAPGTIHDFSGFPAELYARQYPAPGAPAFADLTRRLLGAPTSALDHVRGLDHGAWSVLGRMYPAADIPVYQLSIDYDRPPEYHYDLGRRLKPLREHGVLIVGSGNLVHNLGTARPGARPYDWAEAFDTWLVARISAGDDTAVIGFRDLGRLAALAHPTHDHFLPLLYVLGARDRADRVEFFNSAFDLGSVSMRSIQFG